MLINLNIALFMNLSYFFSGIIFIQAFVIYLTGSKQLKSTHHSLFWLLVFLFNILYTVAYSRNYEFKINLGEYILYFIPIFAWIFVLSIIEKKPSLLKFALLVIPIISLLFLRRIPLFFMIYDVVAWGPLLATGFILLMKKDRFDEKEYRKYKFVFLWTLSVSTTIIIAGLINIILSFINGYPTQVTMVLPILFGIISIFTFYLFYTANLYYSGDFLEKSAVFERQTVTEKIAASLVHEIKNPIAAISSLNQQLSENYKDMSEDSIAKYFDLISKDLGRVKNLAETFLRTARIEEDDKLTKFSDLYIQLNGIYDLIRFDLQKREAELVISNKFAGLKTSISPYGLRQIFFNLIYNAIEANATRIEITPEIVSVNKDYSVRNVNKDALIINVIDNGDGLSAQAASNLFKPFITTKSTGTGIGLSICRQILMKNHGFIELSSSVKGKTVFRIIIN